MSIGDFPIDGCRCPQAWWGIVPPPCPVHNPGTGGMTIVSDKITLSRSPTPISDCDVERIAKRVAELLRVDSASGEAVGKLLADSLPRATTKRRLVRGKKEPASS